MIDISGLNIILVLTAISLALGRIASPGLVSPAAAQSAAASKGQSDAMSAYDAAVNRFKSVLRQRRARIDSREPLPNLPGQALYLARNEVLSTYKDLTDALPSKIGRP